MTLPFQPERYAKFLGIELGADEMKTILEKLECKVENGVITVPSFRSDLACMNDIAEEVMRIYGYDKLTSTNIVAETTEGGRNPKQKFLLEVEHALFGMGLDEIQTFSFISPKYYDKIRLPENAPERRSVVISNPLGEDTGVMRTTTLPSMLETLARNLNFNNENVRLFEVGSVYLPNEDAKLLPTEKRVLTLGLYGDTDFYALKGVLQNLLALAGIGGVTYVTVTDNPSYHPGRCAKIVLATGETLGVFGQLHPHVAENYGAGCALFAAEIDFDLLFDRRNATKEYKPLPKFPAITRDFSLVCDEELEVGKIEAVMARAGGRLVEDIRVFDIYRGPQVGENKKSVSLRMVLRAGDHTMTVDDAEKVTKKVLFLLDKELGLTLRA